MKMGVEGFMVVLLLLYWAIFNVAVECPINFDYVTQMSWNASSCRSIQSTEELKNCGMALRSMLGVGLAQYLRDESAFQLPDNASAADCLTRFQQKLTFLGLRPNLVQLCFNDTSQFVSNPSSCAGIQTKKDWIDKVGTTALDTVCKGDLSAMPACHICHDSGEIVHRQLLGMIKDVTEEISTQCYYFACLYAIGVINEFGSMSRKSAGCILRVPFMHRNPTSHRQIVLYGFMGTAMGSIMLCSVGMCYYLWVKIKNRAKHRHWVETSRGLLKPNTGAVWFSLEQIMAATNNFSATNVIGEGGFGTVYRGTLSDGQQIAVKRIRNCTSEGDSEFINEVEIINSIRHRNLVVLRGFCVASDDTDGRQRFLIYDYLGNGSLDEHIFEERGKNRGDLNWEQRKNIAIGTAKGLCYLHFGVQPAIYHRDIKATNILLDDEMNACVADFGLARITTEGQSHLTTRIAGTHGYLAPEYALYGQLTDRSDVYSFGVVLLEIMSGRKALDTSVESSSDYLITDWAWKLVKTGKTIEILDKVISEKGAGDVMERFVLVGILCAHVMVAFRPSMVEALKMLEGEVDIPEIPDRPLPLLNQGAFDDGYYDSSIFSNSQSMQTFKSSG
ncbi:probable receptor-like protein kinase At1g11050 [Cryptomeria japonica]|uniref:probable receptor-like protein kinase At1g11050 n=1 Tax=Cryptomeria japonica TaxID=3369 RepID=UPI0027D9D4C6|nr:probable receptor-like protein kinase At1g11050 [Cryptomeria japonica]